jgi:hypothetical protein
LKPCYRQSRTGHGLGTYIRPWRSLVDAIRCPALRGYPSRDAGFLGGRGGHCDRW